MYIDPRSFSPSSRRRSGSTSTLARRNMCCPASELAENRIPHTTGTSHETTTDSLKFIFTPLFDNSKQTRAFGKIADTTNSLRLVTVEVDLALCPPNHWFSPKLPSPHLRLFWRSRSLLWRSLILNPTAQ